MTPDAVLAFVDAINHQDPEQLARLMTEDHLFIDSLGHEARGREQMKKGWQGYFGMVPDYAITVTETFVDGSVVAMFGAAQGTWTADGVLKPENRWQTPAAFRAVLSGSLIAEWRVYADNEPIRRLMNPSIPR